MTDRVVRSGSADLAVTEWGEGPPIVALHPGVGDRRIWRGCAPVWAEAGHHVVAHDRRGFGDTAHQPEPHSYLTDLLAVMDATVTGPAVIVGNSRGGELAIDLAVAEPHRVRGLVLIGAGVSGCPWELWEESEAEKAQDALIEAADGAGDTDRVNELEARYWLDGTEQPEGRVGDPARALFLDMNGRALAARNPGDVIPPAEAWPKLPDLAIPTLVIDGEHDLPGQHNVGRAIAERIPGATHVMLEGTAHCPQLDQPEALNALVLDFLAGLD